MSTALGLLAVLLAVISQVAILPAFSIFGVQPNLVIVLLVAWMAVRRRREALLLVPVAGFLLGVFDGQPLGLAMLALAPLILAVEVRELRLVESALLPALAIVLAASLVYEGTGLLSLAVTGGRVAWPASVLDVLVPAAIANALLLLPVYAVVRLASIDVRRQPAF